MLLERTIRLEEAEALWSHLGAGRGGYLPVFLCPFLELEMRVFSWHLHDERPSAPEFS